MTLAELEKLCYAIERWHAEDLAEDQECVRCRCSVHYDAELEPTPLCHSCAHQVVEALPGLLDQLRGPRAVVISPDGKVTLGTIQPMHRDVIDTLVDIVVGLVDLETK